MNEGWASTALQNDDAGRLDWSEIVDYAENNAGVMATSGGRLNPYKLGRRAVPQYRGALEQGPIRPRVGGLRTIST